MIAAIFVVPITWIVLAGMFYGLSMPYAMWGCIMMAVGLFIANCFVGEGDGDD